MDAGHLAEIRRQPTRFAPGGVLHLVLEVIAYAADEDPASDSGAELHGEGPLLAGAAVGPG